MELLGAATTACATPPRPFGFPQLLLAGDTTRAAAVAKSMVMVYRQHLLPFSGRSRTCSEPPEPPVGGPRAAAAEADARHDVRPAPLSARALAAATEALAEGMRLAAVRVGAGAEWLQEWAAAVEARSGSGSVPLRFTSPFHDGEDPNEALMPWACEGAAMALASCYWQAGHAAQAAEVLDGVCGASWRGVCAVAAGGGVSCVPFGRRHLERAAAALQDVVALALRAGDSTAWAWGAVRGAGGGGEAAGVLEALQPPHEPHALARSAAPRHAAHAHAHHAPHASSA